MGCYDKRQVEDVVKTPEDSLNLYKKVYRMRKKFLEEILAMSEATQVTKLRMVFIFVILPQSRHVSVPCLSLSASPSL